MRAASTRVCTECGRDIRSNGTSANAASTSEVGADDDMHPDVRRTPTTAGGDAGALPAAAPSGPNGTDDHADGACAFAGAVPAGCLGA